MADDAKGKKRRGRPPKGAAAGAAKQRTLRDMFGGGSRASKPDPAEGQASQETVIELSDSEPEPSALPSTPGDTLTGSVLSVPGSVSSVSTDADAPPTAVVAPPPKKLFSIFEKRRAPDDIPKGAHTDISTSPADEETAKSTDAVDSHSGPGTSASPSHARSPSVSIVPAPSENHSHAGSSRDIPIIIEPSSPVQEKSKPAPRPSKPVYSIFNRPSRTAGASTSKAPSNLLAPPPSRENQPEDVRTPMTSVTARFPSRYKGKAREVDAPFSDVLLSRLCTPPDDAHEDHPIPSIPAQSIANVQDHIPHSLYTFQSIPSIARLLSAVEASRTASQQEPISQPPSEQWSERWRPRKADQVLGNEQQSLYLRDWLQALRLQGDTMRPAAEAATLAKSRTKKRKAGKNKKPDIVRHVKKRRREGLEDDFYAPDDFTESEDDGYGLDAQSSDWDDIAFCREMDAKINGSAYSTDVSRGSSPPLGSIDEDHPAISYKPARFGRQISNTILLAGPSGSGKTAAVYACAEELGWEVFEVYPGIGERSGAELNKLIGDVGKNHTVKVHQSPKKSSAKAQFFQRAQKATGSAPKRRGNARRVMDSDDELDLLKDADEFVPITVQPEPEPEPAELEPAVNQSVILIEEVDVLYQTDTNFWPALVNIIKQCRRPVVLTCNDLSLVPRDDLPLQDTLHFRPCSLPTAAPYLEALCLAQGNRVARDDMTRILEESNLDLRRTVQHMQVWMHSNDAPSNAVGVEEDVDILDIGASPSLPASSPLTRLDSTASPGSVEESAVDPSEGIQLLRRLDRLHSVASFMDAWADRDSVEALSAFFQDEPLPNSDDQLGYTILYSDVSTDHVPVSPHHQHDRTLLQYTSNCLRHPQVAAMPLSSVDNVEVDRAAYVTQVGPILRSFRAWRAPASEPSLYLDYAPWLRYMIAVEEEQRAALVRMEESTQRRRVTRNSQKSEVQSWLSVDAETRQVLARSGFPL